MQPELGIEGPPVESLMVSGFTVKGETAVAVRELAAELDVAPRDMGRYFVMQYLLHRRRITMKEYARAMGLTR